MEQEVADVRKIKSRSFHRVSLIAVVYRGEKREIVLGNVTP